MASNTPTLRTSDNLLICNACGTQYDVTASSNKQDCAICDDPRQFVPPEGQTFTTLAKLKESGHHNVFERDPVNPKVLSIWTEPKAFIGQRAMLLQTPSGNILWDMIAFLDQETVDKIHALGGLSAIVISHPHYYTTYADWSLTFPSVPIYIGGHDASWLVPRHGTTPPNIHLLTTLHTAILPHVTAILSGGHFPGSLCLHWASQLFIADTIFTVPAALNPVPGKPGVISYGFWYSVPNRIPLDAVQVLAVWRSVRDLEFHTTFGAFRGMDVRTVGNEVERGTGGVKGRMLESCKIFVRAMMKDGMEEEGAAVREIVKEEIDGTERVVVSSGDAEAPGGMENTFEL